MNNKQFFAVGLLLSALWIGEAQGMEGFRKLFGLKGKAAEWYAKLSPNEKEWADMFYLSPGMNINKASREEIETLLAESKRALELASVVDVSMKNLDGHDQFWWANELAKKFPDKQAALFGFSVALGQTTKKAKQVKPAEVEEPAEVVKPAEMTEAEQKIMEAGQRVSKALRELEVLAGVPHVPQLKVGFKEQLVEFYEPKGEVKEEASLSPSEKAWFDEFYLSGSAQIDLQKMPVDGGTILRLEKAITSKINALGNKLVGVSPNLANSEGQTALFGIAKLVHHLAKAPGEQKKKVGGIFTQAKQIGAVQLSPFEQFGGPLLRAIKELIETLVDRGLNPDIVDKYGKTYVDYIPKGEVRAKLKLIAPSK